MEQRLSHLLRAIALLSLAACSLTLVRPRSGWGRLFLFVPKLYAGTFILLFSLAGLMSALLGWLLHHDFLSLAFGLGAGVVGFLYVFRLVLLSRRISRHILQAQTPNGWMPAAMLPQPWVGLWRIKPVPPCTKDVAIGRNEQSVKPILADIWRPANTIEASGLGIVFLHGSGWHYADKDFGTRHFFSHLAWQGHTIVDLAYSLAPEVDLAGMEADVKSAIIWSKLHSEQLLIDRDHLVLMGGSAGGHLALLAAYTSGKQEFDPAQPPLSSSVRAVVSYYGPTGLEAQYYRFRELPGLTGKSRFERAFMKYLEVRTGFEVIPVHQLLQNLMGGSPQEIPAKYQAGSPSSYVSASCPPTLLLQGAHDFSGVAAQVHNLHEALQAAGAQSFLFELPGTEHGFDLYRPAWSPAAQAATYVTERFLGSLLPQPAI
jgi:acetyl esterase/lipase